MTGIWTAAALLAGALALVAAGLCIGITLRLQSTILRRQRELESQAGSLDDAVRMIEARLAEMQSATSASELVDAEVEAAAEMGDAPAEEAIQSIEPEIQAAIAAAAAVAVGPHARVRSATFVKPLEDASPWSQQGRVLVQTSHNLR